MAEVKSTKKEQPMLDPIAYRSDYPEENIIGGEKATVENTDKYQGEGTRNVYNPYDPEMTIDKLDPNYQYGQPAKDINHIDDSYITKRNDQIASALYNEGKITREEVIAFLQGQNNWYNSTEQDRATTIENVWNRIGQYGAENGNKEDKNADVDNSGVDRMRNDMDRNKDGTIYGKTSPEEGKATGGIDTLKDANSVDNIMNEARIANVKALLGMPVEQIAAALESNTIPGDMQAIVDYRDYYPELYAQVEEARKRIRGQDVVNAITAGDTPSSNLNDKSNVNNEIADFAADNADGENSVSDILTSVHNTIASNKSASSASATMDEIEEEVATLNLRLSNLRKEANTVFKGDAPEYLVQAYINNKTQEINDRLKVLESRYQYASTRYDKEVANAQWQKEYELKERQVKVQEDAQALDEWKAKNGVTTTKNSNDKSSTNPGDPYEVTTLSDKEVGEAVDNLLTMFDNGQLGDAQCGVGIQRYYLPMLGISISGISSFENKKKLINEGSNYIPKKGDLIIINSGAKLEDGTPAGHIGIVIGVTKDGYVQYLDWNGKLGADGKGTEKAAMNGIKLDSSKIAGFRNVNKESSTNNSGWTDYDYTKFEQYEKMTSKSEKEAAAAEYGTDIAGMNNLVRDALTNRPKSTTGNGGEDYSNEFGYDPDKGYNIYDVPLYKRYYAGGANTTAETLAGNTNTSTEEFINRARRWKSGNAGKVESMLTEGLNNSQKDILAQIVSGEIELTSEGKMRTYAELLGFGGDTELLNEAIGEAYEIEGKKQLSEALRVAAELQILFEDYKRIKADGNFDTQFYMGAGMLSTIGRKFDQLKNALKLDKVVSARGRGTTFGSMTEGEWEMLGKAVTSLSIALDSDKQFTKGFKGIVTDLWAAQYGTPGGEIIGPTSEEWDNYVQSVKKSMDFTISNGGAKNNPPSNGSTTTGPNAPTSGGWTGGRDSFNNM